MKNLKWILTPLALSVSHLGAQTKTLGPRDYPVQSCTASPASGFLRQCADTVTGNLLCVNSTGGGCTPGAPIASGQVSMGGNAISANTCETATTTRTATGALSTDVLVWSFSADPSGLTGWVNDVSVRAWPTANTANFKLCNTGTPGVTPAAVTLNWLIPGRISGSGGGGGPLLTGALSTPSGTQTLTTLGSSDWAHWGLGSVTGFDHKSTGGMQISNYTHTGGTSTIAQATNNPFGFTWTDGTPTASATATTTGIYIMNGLVGEGLQFTAPATTTTHTLLVYIGVYFARGQMVAHLSDSSAADYTDTGLNDAVGTVGGVPGLYTLTYRAASAGQTLTITYSTNTLDGSGGNVSLQAAALQ